MSDIQIAAQHLYEAMGAPSGSIGVLAWPDALCPRIRVFFESNSSRGLVAIPDEFEGFVVEVEKRVEARPHKVE